MEDNQDILLEEQVKESPSFTDEELMQAGPSINHLALFLNTYPKAKWYDLHLQTDIYIMGDNRHYLQSDEGYWMNYIA